MQTYRVLKYPLDRWNEELIASITNSSEPEFQGFSDLPSVHGLAAQQSVSRSEDGVFDCADVMPAPSEGLPSLEQMLCEVVARADGEAWGDIAAEPAAGPSAALTPPGTSAGVEDGDADAAAGVAARGVAALAAAAAVLCALA